MSDPRYTKLAELLIHHSTDLQSGEHILIEAFDMPHEMVVELVKVAQDVGGHAHVALRDMRVLRALQAEGEDAAFKAWSAYDLERMKRFYTQTLGFVATDHGVVYDSVYCIFEDAGRRS